MKKADKGLTLVELIMATVLLCVIFFTASSILINFRGFFTTFSQSSPSVVEATAALESIAARIMSANWVFVGGAGNSTIVLRVDDVSNPPTPASFTDDTTYRYWWNSVQRNLNLMINNGTNTVMADRITGLSFTLTHPVVGTSVLNTVRVILTTNATGKNETLETTVAARCGRGN